MLIDARRKHSAPCYLERTKRERESSRAGQSDTAFKLAERASSSSCLAAVFERELRCRISERETCPHEIDKISELNRENLFLFIYNLWDFIYIV